MEPVGNLCFAYRLQIPCVQSNVEGFVACALRRQLVRVTIQQTMSVERQCLIAETYGIIRPAIGKILTVGKCDRLTVSVACGRPIPRPVSSAVLFGSIDSNRSRAGASSSHQSS